MRNTPGAKNTLRRAAVLIAALLPLLLLAAGVPLPGGGGREALAADVPAEVWEPCAPGGFSNLTVCKIEAASQGTAYAVVDDDPGKVLKTTDYGDSWTVIGLAAGFGSTTTISLVNDEVVWAGSVQRGVAVTADGGEHWVYASAPIWMYAIEATGENNAWQGGFYGGNGHIHYTGDKGLNWTAQIYGPTIEDISRSGQTVWAAGGGTNGKILRYDGAGGWVDKTPSGTLPALHSCCTVDEDTVWAAGGGAVLRTTDGGESWEVSSPSAAGGKELFAISALSATTAFAVGDSGVIIKTSDGGATWERMYNPSTQKLKGVCAVDATHAWAVGEKGTVLRLVQANTRVGSGVSVDLGGGDTITFESVTAAGNTVKSSATAPSGGEFSYHRPVKCVDISTSASFAGEAEASFPYDDSGRDERAFRMFHDAGSGWEDVTHDIDRDNNIITGRVTSLSTFMVIYPYPKIETVTPSWGIRGGDVDVELRGYAFWEADGDKPTIKLQTGGAEITATDVVVHDLYHASCRFALPADASLAKWNVYIMNFDGRNNTLNSGFRVMDPMPPPTVTSTSPGFAARGTQGVQVDINGSGFWEARPAYPSAWLSRAGQPDIEGTIIGISGDTRVRYRFDLPAGADSGPWDVHVKNPDGQEATLAGGFMVTGALPAPTATGITPDSGEQGSTVAVTDLAGSGFWGTPTVKLKKAGQADITASGVTVQSPDRITCSLAIRASAAVGAWDVVVTNQDTQGATLPAGFHVTSGGGGGNTPPGTEVEVDLGGGVGVGFESVSDGGDTAAALQPDPSVANFHILGGSCYDITTTATYAGTILVTLPYDEGALTVPETSLRMLHEEGGGWVDVTKSLDAAANTITGEVSSLSRFVIGWRAAPTWYLAEGCTGEGFETWVLVQNPGADQVTVDLVLQTSSGEQRPAGLQQQTVQPGSRRSFNLGSYLVDWSVSTKVEASGDVICERAMYGNGRQWAHDSIGTTTPARTWYLAEGCTGEGFETWVLVQNPGADQVTVDLVLQTSSGEQRPAGLQQQTVQPGSRRSFNLGSYLVDWSVSTKVEASGDVICERAMYGNGRQWAHDSVGYAPIK